ncbi:MAG: hypothetical protein AAB209_06270, partial [Bacteroidota bacterium]
MKGKWLSVYSLLVYAFLYLPIIILIIFSFNRERINVVWTGFTFDWYITTQRTCRSQLRAGRCF